MHKLDVSRDSLTNMICDIFVKLHMLQYHSTMYSTSATSTRCTGRTPDDVCAHIHQHSVYIETSM